MIFFCLYNYYLVYVAQVVWHNIVHQADPIVLTDNTDTKDNFKISVKENLSFQDLASLFVHKSSWKFEK